MWIGFTSGEGFLILPERTCISNRVTGLVFLVAPVFKVFLVSLRVSTRGPRVGYNVLLFNLLVADVFIPLFAVLAGWGF